MAPSIGLSRRILVTAAFATVAAAFGMALERAFAAPSELVTGTLSQGRLDHTMMTLPDGRVLLAGGATVRGGTPLRSAEFYDPAARSFAPTGQMVTARVFHAAVLLLDGTVLVLGGQDSSGGSTASAELYNPATGSFHAVGSMGTGRNGISSTATLLKDGSVLVVGAGTAELYDPAKETFAATGPPVTMRQTHAAARLADGRVLLSVGTDGGADGVTTTEVYDPATGTFTATGFLVSARLAHAAVTLPDGRVLIVGGIRTLASTTGDRRVASAELYDPSTGQSVMTGAPLSARTLVRALALDAGSVLVYRDSLDIEIYDPVGARFFRAGVLAAPRNAHAAAVLADGRVLFTGGWLSPAGQPTPPASERIGVASAELFEAPAPPDEAAQFGGTLPRSGFGAVPFGGTIDQLRAAMEAVGCDAPIFATRIVNGQGEFVAFFPTSALSAPNTVFLNMFPGGFITEGTPLLGATAADRAAVAGGGLARLRRPGPRLVASERNARPWAAAPAAARRAARATAAHVELAAGPAPRARRRCRPARSPGCPARQEEFPGRAAEPAAAREARQPDRGRTQHRTAGAAPLAAPGRDRSSLVRALTSSPPAWESSRTRGLAHRGSPTRRRRWRTRGSRTEAVRPGLSPSAKASDQQGSWR